MLSEKLLKYSSWITLFRNGYVEKRGNMKSQNEYDYVGIDPFGFEFRLHPLKEKCIIFIDFPESIPVDRFFSNTFSCWENRV